MNTVLICGGEINDEFSLVCLKQIKPDCIIGVDKGLEFCYRNHVIPDWILGDFDSISKAWGNRRKIRPLYGKSSVALNYGKERKRRLDFR